jgi:hypothetical protein
MGWQQHAALHARDAQLPLQAAFMLSFIASLYIPPAPQLPSGS